MTICTARQSEVRAIKQHELATNGRNNCLAGKQAELDKFKALTINGRFLVSIYTVAV